MADRVHFSWKGKSGSFSIFLKTLQPRIWKGTTIVAQGCCDNSDPLTAQKDDLIWHNKDGFLAVTNQAGIHIFCIFIPDDMASLSTMMPLNFIAELKWMFQGAFGCSPFTSLKSGLKSTWCCAKTSNWPSGSQSAWALPLLCQWPVTFAVQCWKGW